MTEFLVNKFIKDSANIESTEVRTRYGMLASVVGIFCNVLLFSVKLAIGLILSYPAVPGQAGGRHCFRFHRHHGRCFQ